MTQAEDVLNYIKENGSVSSYDAFVDLGIVSLQRRISDLKQRGYSFKIKKMLKFNKKNKLISYNRYSLDEEQCRIMGVMTKQHDIKELFPFLKNGYVAMDKYGDWSWWQIEPAVLNFFWYGIGHSVCLSRCFNLAPYSGNWKDSLMKVEVAE